MTIGTVNIATTLDERAVLSPDQPALYLPKRRHAGTLADYESVMYRDLATEVQAVAAGLVQAGIGRDVRTALMVPPSREFFVLTFALFRVGAVPVFIDPGMPLPALKQCLDEASPEAFIGIPKAHLARLLFGWGRRSLKRFVTTGRGILPGLLTYTALKGRGRAGIETHGVPAVVLKSPDEVAAILFTSGSTGIPKGAVYTHGIFLSQVRLLGAALKIEPGEIDLCTFPLFALFAPALGMTAVVPQMNFTKPGSVDPEAIFRPIELFGVTNLFGSPALIDRVSRRAKEEGRTFPTLRRILSAGAPVAPRIVEACVEMLPSGAQLWTPYGATESLPVALVGSDELRTVGNAGSAAGKGICIGRVFPEMDVTIIPISDEPIARWEDVTPLPPGRIGEIVVHGPVVTQSYDQRPEQTGLAKIYDRESGRMRHRVGDLGYFDDEGRLWFCGRKAHRVVLPTETLFTDCCEGIFNSHPSVYRSALVAGEQNGKTVPAICFEYWPSSITHVRDRRNPSGVIEELKALARQHEQTRSITHFFVHPGFPMDIRHNSKIFREKLRPWVTAQLGKERP